MAFDNKKPIELEDGWKYMEEGITKLKLILENDTDQAFTAEHYMMLYTTIYNMCTQKPPYDHSEQLYNRYRGAFETYIVEMVLPSLKGHHGDHLLKQLVARWNNHKIMIRWLSRFFNYLDRYYIQRHNLHSLNDVGLLAFKEKVYGEIKVKTKDAVLAQIESEREGEAIDAGLLRNVLSIFQEVGMGELTIYQQDFEDPLLKDTGEYYRRKAAVWIEEDSTPDYLIKTEECLKAEEARVESYLHSSTKARLLKEAENQLLREHLQSLLEKEGSGAAVLLQNDKKDDLARMHRLFGRLGQSGLQPLADLFRKHVEEQGIKLVREATEAAEAKKANDKKAGKVSKDGGNTPEHQFIQNVVALHDKYADYVTDCFTGNSLFHKSLKEAFESFCNKQVTGSSVAELMATFCDTLLRKGGGEKLTEEELDTTLDKVVKLLAYVSDKDLFSEFYRKKLSRRLLNAGSASEDSEKAVLTRLKQQCGQQFTSKMEGMVQDLQLAKEKEKEFAGWLQQRGTNLPLDMTVMVLTTGFWPSYKAYEINLPEEMMRGIESFNEFHDAQNQKSRKLTWQFSMGTVHMKAHFKVMYELILHPFIASVLYLFNDKESLSYSEIAEASKMAKEDLERVLLPLVFGKHKLLIKEPSAKGISPDDVFTINTEFSDKMRRIRIQLPTIDDRKKVSDDVGKDRKHQIDAAIVRVMKSRKALNHQNLIMEVVQQLQKMFQPDIKAIKRCIEGLIDREFLERDSQNQQMYKYLA